MNYVLAILLPPVGLAMVQKPLQAILCLLLMLTVLGWPIASVWAVLVVHEETQAQALRDAIEEIKNAPK